MISIRRKLLHSILLVVFVVTLLLGGITYFSVREEMDEFYDENLKQVAHTILSTNPTNKTSSLYKENTTKLHGEEEYLTQVWNNGALEYSSHPHVGFPLQEKDGKGKMNFHDSTWRFYKKSNGNITVQLAQDLAERHSVVLEIYGLLLIPILIQFPILALLIWCLIGYGLRPLHEISNLIKNRNSSFLAPLPNDRIPIEIQILVHELNNLLSRLKISLETQRQFTADAAHELRTPLTAIRLQLDILKRADNKEEEKAALLSLEKGILRSTHLVQQLLELARQEPENLESPFITTDLAHLVEECAEQNLPLAQEKDIHMTIDLIDRPMITGNAQKLTVMIDNLINNAIAYTQNHGDVKITLRQEEGGAILDIVDNGIGIPSADQDRIFDRFYRVPGTGVTGSGLGLSIVRNIADIHQATIQISPGIDGRGTNFRVCFKPDTQQENNHLSLP